MSVANLVEYVFIRGCDVRNYDLGGLDAANDVIDDVAGPEYFVGALRPQSERFCDWFYDLLVKLLKTRELHYNEDFPWFLPNRHFRELGAALAPSE